MTARVEDVETALCQLIDAGDGNPERAGDLDHDTLLDLARQLPDGEWSDADWALIDRAWQAHVVTHRIAADEIRSACQMTGRATLGRVVVRPNPEFVCQSGTAQVRLRQLTGWPSSPHFWVAFDAPDGESEVVDGADLGSWGAVLTQAREQEQQWSTRTERERQRKLARLREAKAAHRAAAAALLSAELDVGRAAADLGQEQPAAQTMSAAEFATRRHRLGLTLDELSSMLKVNPRTVRSWESGRDSIPPRIRDELDHLTRLHAETVAEMVDRAADTTVLGIIRDKDVTAQYPRGWYVAAAGRAMDSDPDIVLRWLGQ